MNPREEEEDEEEREVLYQILVRSLENLIRNIPHKLSNHLVTVELRLLVAVHCWIQNSVLLPCSSNLKIN